MALGMHSGGLSRGAQDHRRISTLEKSIWPPARGTVAPVQFAHYVKQQLIARRRHFVTPTRKQFDEYFKFAIVRNPWDRAYSWYRNVVRDPIHRRNFDVAEDTPFDEFVDRHLDCWALDPQLEWLCDESGDVVVDYVGKFEELADAFGQVQERLGIQQSELPRALHSPFASYRDAYSAELRELVAAKYAKEIELFGYTFD